MASADIVERIMDTGMEGAMQMLSSQVEQESLPDSGEIPAAITTALVSNSVAKNDLSSVRPQPAQGVAYSSSHPQIEFPSTSSTLPSVKPVLPENHHPASSEMQPPPAKRQRIHNYDRRPRLSICPSVSPDAELVEDRDRNDNTLKGKFEAIFEKYSRDFTDIGDEINVMTGEVMVDNGHILSMKDETDPGSPSRARPSVYREGTLQSFTPMRQGSRSMTVGAEEVIASIEAMAQRVATGQTPYPDEYESDNDMTPYQRSGSVSSDSLLGIGGDDYQNDWESPKSASRDSLLGLEEQGSSIESFYDDPGMLPLKDDTTSVHQGKSGSGTAPIVLSSGPIVPSSSTPLEGWNAHPKLSHGHSESQSCTSKPPSPPPFIKSNGKSKIVATKFNVSKAYEEMQRQASSTLAASGLKRAEISKSKSCRARPRTKKPPNHGSSVKLAQIDGAVPEPKTVLKRLPVPRPSSEPRTLEGDYESDDPLQ